MAAPRALVAALGLVGCAPVPTLVELPPADGAKVMFVAVQERTVVFCSSEPVLDVVAIDLGTGAGAEALPDSRVERELAVGHVRLTALLSDDPIDGIPPGRLERLTTGGRGLPAFRRAYEILLGARVPEVWVEVSGVLPNLCGFRFDAECPAAGCPADVELPCRDGRECRLEGG